MPDSNPARIGPRADKLSIWPMDDGRYGLDATFQGKSGFQHVERHEELLKSSGMSWSLRQELGGGWTLRFGPLTTTEISKALTLFMN